MSKKTKNKGDEELERELKQNLNFEIKLLESKIYSAARQEIEALEELERMRKLIADEEKLIQDFSNDQGKKIKLHTAYQNDSLEQNQTSIKGLEENIKEKDLEIQKYRDEIEQIIKSNNDTIEGLDMNIAEHKSQFEQMSIRFENILQKTAAKLQEKTEVGR